MNTRHFADYIKATINNSRPKIYGKSSSWNLAAILSICIKKWQSWQGSWTFHKRGFAFCRQDKPGNLAQIYFTFIMSPNWQPMWIAMASSCNPNPSSISCFKTKWPFQWLDRSTKVYRLTFWTDQTDILPISCYVNMNFSLSFSTFVFYLRIRTGIGCFLIAIKRTMWSFYPPILTLTPCSFMCMTSLALIPLWLHRLGCYWYTACNW